MLSFLLTETRTKIAIIDTGLNIYPSIQQFMCNQEHFDYTSQGFIDNNGHGTNIATIISKNVDFNKYCMVIYKYYVGSNEQSLYNELKALKDIAKDDAIKFVNFSSSGNGSNPDEQDAIEDIVKKKVYFVTAAGNNGEDTKLHPAYPGCYNLNSKYFRTIGNEGNKTSNYGKCVTHWEKGSSVCAGKTQQEQQICLSGTSQAAAIHTNKLVRGLIE